MEQKQRKILVILNPKGGNSNADVIRAEFDRHFGSETAITTIYETTAEDHVPDVVQRYGAKKYDMVVACGGDGTVSDVAEALVGTGVPFGIVPAGTGNVLARDLGVPLDIPQSIELLASEHAITKIDAMRANGRYFVVSIGSGIDSLMVRDTPREAKRRWGRLAYAWTIVRSMVGYEGRRYVITVDGRRYRFRATQVLIANTAAVGADPLTWGDHIHPNDGVIDICILSARTIPEMLGVMLSAVRRKHKKARHIEYLTARRSIMLATIVPMPVQADGEMLGDTPLRIEVIPQAVSVVVPLAAATQGALDVVRAEPEPEPVGAV